MAGSGADAVLRYVHALFRSGAAGGVEDGRLLERFASGGDETAAAAFAALVERHGPMVLRVCRRVLGDAHDAEDAAQATFLVLARKARSVRRRDSVANWLFGVALRIALRARAASARRRESERRGAEMAARLVGEGARGDSWAELYEELDRLPERYRAPLVLCYLEGLTNEQAAHRLRCPTRTVQRRLAEGRERLRVRLARRGVAPGAALVAGLSAESAAAAELPAAWAGATVRAAVGVAAGRGAAGVASASALALMEGAMRAMLRSKLKLAATSVLVAGIIMVGSLPLALGQRAPEPGRKHEGDPAPVRGRPEEASKDGVPADRPPIEEKPAVPGQGRVLRLSVVAADTGKPIPNARVRVWIFLGDHWRTADEQGRLDIAHSTGPADKSLGVDAWGDGYAMQRHNWGHRPGEPVPDEATLRLQPGESLAGSVQDEQGRPIAGADVYLWSHNYRKKDPHELLYDLRATSGADGRWRTSGAPETTGELLGFHVVHPDYLSTRDYASKEVIPKIADLRAGRAVTVMKKGVPIAGRVVDAEGRPVAGALVVSTDRQGALFTDVDQFAVTTDGDGRFRTGQVKASEWFLLARARGHAPGEGRVKVGTAVPQVEIALGRPRTLEGRVVDPAGRPVAGAFVNVDTWRGYRCLGVFLYSDAEGRFRWEDAPDDEILVNVDLQGYAGVSRRRVGPDDRDVSFTLRPSLAVRGKVRDAETDARIEVATVELGAVDPETGEVSKWTGRREAGSGVGVYKGELSINFPVEAESYKLRIVAEGYAPFISRAFRRDERAVFDYDIKLAPARPEGPVAAVIRPDGQPLARARVYSTQLNQGLSLHDGVVGGRGGGGRAIRTGPDGTFPVPRYDKPFFVLILGDDAYAYASKEALAGSPRLQARPYGRVEGRYLVGGRPAPNQPLELSGILQDESTMFCHLSFGRKATTDGDGRFTIEGVIPMPHLRIARRDRSETPGWVRSIGEPVHVAPGATARVTVGGRGRPVVGRVEAPEGWDRPVDYTDRGGASVESNRPIRPSPLSLFRDRTSLQDAGWSEWSRAWSRSPEGIAYEDARVAVAAGLAPDGSFRIDDLPAGEYRLVVRLNEDEIGRERGPFARLAREFTIPPIPGGRSDEALDLGVLRLRPRTELKAGDPAPPFEVTSVEGKALRLEDYRGRFLLLDFGATWDDQSRFQVTRLNDVHRRFGDDARFAILSLVMGPDGGETRAFVAEKGQPWPQAIVGPLSNPVALAYGVEDRDVPAAILIGPDGKLIAKGLRYDQIGKAVGQALGR
jgi:RNA polymerase sigma factor (sigma-70 family)